MSTIADLIVAKTASAIYAAGLAIATGLGVPVTSWEVGDPTRAMYRWLSQKIEALESVTVGFFNSAFLDFAAADSTLYTWLCIVAEQNFGYIPRTATYATCSVVLTNTKGGIYPFDVGDITIKNSGGFTYHNTEGGTLLGTATLTLAFEADLPGSESTMSAGVPEMVTTFLGVTATNAAAFGQDAEPATSIVSGCRAKLARMTNGGPKDAYVSVALDSALTGTTVPTRARATSDSLTGIVSVYLASDSGAVPAPDLAKVQTALTEWAAPLCVTPIAASATAENITIQYAVAAYKSWGVTTDEAVAAINLSVLNWVAARPIGGDIIPPSTIGILAKNMVESAIRSASDKIISIELLYPDDLPYFPLATQIFKITSIVGTVTMVEDP